MRDRNRETIENVGIENIFWNANTIENANKNTKIESESDREEQFFVFRICEEQFIVFSSLGPDEARK